MGCDIHLHIELLLNGKWEHYAAPNVERWYWLFGVMAGVRNTDVVPIVNPKGFPKDASIITKIAREEYGETGHTDSWLDHNEIMKLEDRLLEYAIEKDKKPLDFDLEYSILHTFCFGNSFTAHWRYGDIRYLPDEVDDVRFVFWFDN